MNSYFINMKTDYGFKKIFEDMDLLRDFLNDMLCGERTVASAVSAPWRVWNPVIRNGCR